jgi:nucleotide-binding universal stress UspA family protein
MDDHHIHHHAADTDAHAHAARHHAERANIHPAIVVALDESPSSAAALAFALAHTRDGDDLYLLNVLPPLAMAVSAPVAPTLGVAAAAKSWEEQRSLDEQAAKALLRAAAKKALSAGVSRACLHAHVLPAAGGASGVAASITEFILARHGGGDRPSSSGDEAGGVALVVVGTRGMGSGKAFVMGALGLGSVSDYVLNHSPAPVAIVPAASAEEEAPPSTATKKVVVVAVDESPHSAAALSFAAERGLIAPSTAARLATAAVPVPFPVLDETAAASALEARSWADSNEVAVAYAQEVAERAAKQAKTLLLRSLATATAEQEASLDVQGVALKGGGGGPADAGAAVASYASEQKAAALVVGSRGMGALKRALAGLVGLGSVSLYLAHHASCPVIVVRGPPPPPQGAAAAAAAAAAADAKKEGKQN